MLKLQCRKALFMCLFSAIVVITCSSAASAYGPSDAHTWGLDNAGLNITIGSVITNAKLTIHNAAFDPASNIKTATVRLLNNPELGVTSYTDGQAGDYFADCGALVAELKSGSLTSTNVVIDLSQKDDPAAPIWQNFGRPFEVTLGSGVKVGYSSTMVALLDYAGSGRSFGFGVDCDGFTFTDLSLELTVASMNDATPAQTLRFSASGNTPPPPPPSGVDTVIIDNSDSAVSMVGTWPVSGGLNPYGADSVYNRDAGNSFSFLFTAPETAWYETSMWWTEFSSRSTATPVTVEYADDTVHLTVDQTQNGGIWNVMGIWRYEIGKTYRVTIHTLTDRSSICADAVRFVKTQAPTMPSEVIIDNTDINTAIVGTWPASSGANPYGTGSVYNRQSGNSFSWLFTAPETASYEVSMWWTELASRSAAVPVRVEHAAGTASMTVNQQTAGGQWNILGTYQCESGVTYRITVSTLSDNSTICADAVRFKKNSGTIPPPPPANNPPVIAPIADQAVTTPNTLTFTVQASDPDGDNVSVSVQNLPAGAAFSSNIFSWTPSAAQVGTYAVTFTADDGKGATASISAQITVQSAPLQWTQLAYDDFESGWGNYTDGGADCLLYKNGKYAHQGTNAANIQSGGSLASSFALTNGLDISKYSELKIEFWYIPVSMETGDTFRLDYYDGTQWRRLKRWAAITDFTSFNFYAETLTISKTNYAFPANMKIRFVCEAADRVDDVMIDEIAISAK